VPVFTVAQEPEGLQALANRAEERHTTLQLVPPLESYPGGEILDMGWLPCSCSPFLHSTCSPPLALGLHGKHQRTNAALAMALCRTFIQTRFNLSPPLAVSAGAKQPGEGVSTEVIPNGFRIPDFMKEGLASATWPGRGQQYRAPDSPQVAWYLDGAHTIESLEAGV